MPTPDTPNPRAIAYMERLKARERAEYDTSITSLMAHAGRRSARQPFTPYPYTIDQAYPLALQLYEQRLASLGRKLVWESDSEMIFRELVRYFIGDAGGLYDIHRGIYLFGDFGTGKTVIMQTMQDFTRLIEERLTAASVAYTPRGFRLSHARDIAMEIQRSARTDSLRQYHAGIWLFDDMGHEEEKKIYGNDINALAEILLARYNRYQAGGPPTHCTSNLAPHECREAYGDRIGSRVFELFNHVYLDGSDKRKLNNER